MKSRASIKSHPLHPIMIAFPVAFFSGTFIFDILSVVLDINSFWQTAQHLEIAGVASAVLAAIPGLIDYFKTIPPDSSAKKRGAQHGILNITHTLIFLAAWLLRDDSSHMLIIAMESAGIILLGIAGWMGGTLVYRNQIGVDQRYANAGKWKEMHVPATGSRIEVAAAGELQINQMKLVHAGDKRIVIGRTEKGYVAFDDHCTHRGGSLAGGSMICGTVQCPWHGSQFDVNTGAVKAGPATNGISTYRLSESGGKIYLEL